MKIWFSLDAEVIHAYARVPCIDTVRLSVQYASEIEAKIFLQRCKLKNLAIGNEDHRPLSKTQNWIDKSNRFSAIFGVPNVRRRTNARAQSGKLIQSITTVLALNEGLYVWRWCVFIGELNPDGDSEGDLMRTLARDPGAPTQESLLPKSCRFWPKGPWTKRSSYS